uniref:Uncharacterized protein n=1 Tax=Ciona intestinalis TaxID=7719 RepID=H2XVS7_CIOIN
MSQSLSQVITLSPYLTYKNDCKICHKDICKLITSTGFLSPVNLV